MIYIQVSIPFLNLFQVFLSFYQFYLNFLQLYYIIQI
nr:MAG TPA: hypothetical protein [Caudoviricetes sp.]